MLDNLYGHAYAGIRSEEDEGFLGENGVKGRLTCTIFNDERYNWTTYHRHANQTIEDKEEFIAVLENIIMKLYGEIQQLQNKKD